MPASLPPLSEVLDLLPDAVCIVDESGRIQFVNATFERLLGHRLAAIKGHPLFDYVHPEDREATAHQARALMAGGGQRHFRNRYLHRDGQALDLLWSAHWLPDRGVRIGVAREIGDMRRAERELEDRANHDPLTGLANRHRLQQALEDALQQAQARDGHVSLLFLDLDGFKEVNDRGGHEAGDRILCEVGRRLQTGLRQIDLVARMGGDEFVVLLPGCSAVDATAVAAQLRGHLRAPCALDDGPLQLDASIGIASYPGDGATAEALVTRADAAMYALKRRR